MSLVILLRHTGTPTRPLNRHLTQNDDNSRFLILKLTSCGKYNDIRFVYTFYLEKKNLYMDTQFTCQLDRKID